MLISRMTDCDIQEVKQIEEECYLSYWSADDYRNEINRPDSFLFVAKLESKVVGFLVSRLITINLKLLESSELSENSGSDSEIEIYNLAVKPIFQQKGIGQMLINQLLDSTQQIVSKTFWLEVRESNITAIKFYKRNGFNTVSKRKSFYCNPNEDGIIMNKVLIDF